MEGIEIVNPDSFRIRIEANEDTSFTVMFEPSGMPYNLGPSQYMYAEIPSLELNELTIVQWNGGISIEPPGPVTTFDSDGSKLHDLHY